MHFANVIYVVKTLETEEGLNKIYCGFIQCHETTTEMSSKDPDQTKIINTKISGLNMDDKEKILSEFIEEFGHNVEGADNVYPLGQLYKDLDQLRDESVKMFLTLDRATGKGLTNIAKGKLNDVFIKRGCVVMPKFVAARTNYC